MRVEDRGPSELWRIDGEGRGVDFPNGVGFAPGGRTIYHANDSAGSVLAHDFADEPAPQSSTRRIAWRGQRLTASSTFGRRLSSGCSIRTRAWSSSPTWKISGASRWQTALPSQSAGSTITRIAYLPVVPRP